MHHFTAIANPWDGATPLHWAAQQGASAPLVTLLDAGANTKALDKHGKTPFDYAQENKQLSGSQAYWRLNDAQYE